jgi:heme/copper-type cytochrome/quinol oxidase subunit 3
MEIRTLPVGSVDHRSAGWFGVWALIASESALFVFLLFSFYYTAVQPQSGAWPPEAMSLRLALPNTVILLTSSAAAWWGQRGIKRDGSRWQQVAGLGAAVILGLVFLIIQYIEWRNKAFSISTGVYGSLYFTVTGFHMAHVVVGVIVLLTLSIWSALGYFGPQRGAAVSTGVAYWHFVDAVWLTVFFTFYVTPLLGLSHVG